MEGPEGGDGGADMTMTCTACQYVITTLEERGTHYKTEWHRYNVKRRCAGLPGLSKEIFDSKLSALQAQQSATLAEPTKQVLKCYACNKSFKSQKAYDNHLQSKMHLKKQKSVQSSPVPSRGAPMSPTGPALEPIPLPLVNAVVANSDAVCLQCGRAFASAELRKKHQEETGHAQRIPSLSSPPAPSAKEDAPSSAQAPPSDEKEKMTKFSDPDKLAFKDALPVGQCLFCPHKASAHDTVPKILEHMLKVHGFFVPFAEYLVDVVGLLEYLGAKVGMGKVCLHCNGRGRAFFPTVEALQKHMVDKGHCKLRFEDDEDDDEFTDYYRFPHQIRNLEEEELKQGGAVAVAKSARELIAVNAESTKEAPRRTLSSINDVGELVMSDGSTIGHRSLRQTYNQNVRPDADAQLATVIATYKRLALKGYDGMGKAMQSERKHFDRTIRKADANKFKGQYRANSKKYFLDPTAHLM